MDQYSREFIAEKARLRPEDLGLVRTARRSHNQLGLAYQIAFIRLTGRAPGQRYLFPRKTLKATYSHRLGDYALEFYTFVADNYAPFYSTPIECTERDAAYVLDGLLLPRVRDRS